MWYKIIRSQLTFFIVLALCIFTFPRLISILHAQTFKAGETPSSHFFVAVFHEGGKPSFQLIPFKDASAGGKDFYAKKDSETLQTGEFEFSTYRVLEQSGRRRVIETVQKTDDYTFTSQYKVENGRVIPLRYQVFGLGEFFSGFVLAIIFCAFLFYILRRCAKRQQTS
jgi:hypothetical protein